MHDTRRTRVVLAVLLTAALALITFDARNSAAGPVRGLRALGGIVFGSAENVASGVTQPVAAFLNNVGSAAQSRDTISALQRQVVQLRGELSQARLSKADEAQLQKLLQLAGRGRYRIVADYLTDPTRDAVLVRVRLEPKRGSGPLALYVRLDPSAPWPEQLKTRDERGLPRLIPPSTLAAK